MPNQVVQCTACNHYCRISPDKTGICGVRLNKNGVLYLAVHSRPSAVHVDPIEKKPLYHFYPNSQIFSIGTIGCNFKCDFCQNWSLSMERPGDIEDRCQQEDELTPQQVIDFCLRKKIPSIAFTYNEPTIWIEYNLDICKLAHRNNIKTVYKTNGFMSPEVRSELVKYISAINIDLKCFNEASYVKMGGRLKEICDNIKFFFDNNITTEVTTLIIPGLNDSPEELTQIAQFLSSISTQIPWHLSAFHPDYKMKNVSRTPLTTLERAHEIGKQFKLQNIYLGNVSSQFTSTICDCGQELVNRSGYHGMVTGIRSGKCVSCGKDVYGQFD
ncbi:Pyruvate_formate-lyase activating enzyme [Hexamita inflata]|uniref:Pyruvate formate-lyase activating enzyme n=1 Tax=Hexamita inflata TaxID=28002 RepID=A0AA86QHE8_9EUKA|nr:Pyruvate formate-lyase activating enzyme [Hexamita inflata]